MKTYPPTFLTPSSPQPYPTISHLVLLLKPNMNLCEKRNFWWCFLSSVHPREVAATDLDAIFQDYGVLQSRMAGGSVM